MLSQRLVVKYLGQILNLSSVQFLALIVAGNVTDVETVLVVGRGLRRRQQRHGGLRPRFAETGITDARKR